MIDAKTQKLLQDIFRREGRSFSTYISGSFPWTGPGGREALAHFQGLAEEEQQALAAFSRFLARRRYGVPYLGPYPEAFTTLNYVSLEHLVPLLVDYQNRAVADLEQDLAGLSDLEARAEVQKILDMKQRHLESLKALTPGDSEPAAVAHSELAVTVH